MGTAIVGVAGALLGVLAGGFLQHLLAARSRHWQREDALGKLKQTVYAEYLRAISASHGQAMAGERTRAEDAACTPPRPRSKSSPGRPFPDRPGSSRPR